MVKTVMKKQRSGKQSGFTLTEAMVAMSLVAILAALSGPSFSNLMATMQVKATASDIQTGLLLARSEAVTLANGSRTFR